MATREPIYSALWSLIADDPRVKGRFVTASRFLIPFEEMPSAQMPALFLIERGEAWIRPGKGISPKRTLRAQIWVYSWESQPLNVPPSILLNDFMDVIDDVLTVVDNPTNTQTLGGLVEHVYIEGEVAIAEGILQNVSILSVPITMLIP